MFISLDLLTRKKALDQILETEIGATDGFGDSAPAEDDEGLGDEQLFPCTRIARDDGGWERDDGADRLLNTGNFRGTMSPTECLGDDVHAHLLSRIAWTTALKDL
jgi:hypothetical protein